MSLAYVCIYQALICRLHTARCRTVGTFQHSAAYRALRDAGICLLSYVNEVLGRIAMSADIACLSVGDDRELC